MDLCEVLSKACIEVFRISVNEDFRKEFLGFLKVTNGSDAEDVLTKKLKSLKQRPQVCVEKHNTSIEPHSSSDVLDQNPVSDITALELGLKCSIQARSHTSTTTQPNQLTIPNVNDCEMAVNTDPSSIQIPGVFTEKEDLVDKPTDRSNGLRSSNTYSNVSQPSQITVQNEEDEFGFWKTAYHVIGAANCKRSLSENSVNDPSTKAGETAASRQVSGSNLRLQTSSVESNTQPSQSILREHEHLQESGSTPMEVNEDCSPVTLSTNMTEEVQHVLLEPEPDKSPEATQIKPSRSIIINEEDEFGFWDLVDDKFIPNKLSTHKTEEVKHILLEPKPDKSPEATQIQPSRSIIINEEDEFWDLGFWEKIIPNKLAEVTLQEARDENHISFELKLQKTTVDANNQPRPMVISYEEDEFGFWNLVSDNCIPKELSTNMTEEVQHVLLEPEPDKSPEATQIQPSRSIIINEEDEFGFWDLVDDKFIPNKVECVRVDNTVGAADPRHDVNGEKLQHDNIQSNLTPPSQSIFQNEDEFDLWNIYFNTIGMTDSNSSRKRHHC